MRNLFRSSNTGVYLTTTALMFASLSGTGCDKQSPTPSSQPSSPVTPKVELSFDDICRILETKFTIAEKKMVGAGDHIAILRGSRHDPKVEQALLQQIHTIEGFVDLEFMGVENYFGTPTQDSFKQLEQRTAEVLDITGLNIVGAQANIPPGLSRLGTFRFQLQVDGYFPLFSDSRFTALGLERSAEDIEKANLSHVYKDIFLRIQARLHEGQRVLVGVGEAREPWYLYSSKITAIINKDMPGFPEFKIEYLRSKPDAQGTIVLVPEDLRYISALADQWIYWTDRHMFESRSKDSANLFAQQMREKKCRIAGMVYGKDHFDRVLQAKTIQDFLVDNDISYILLK